MNTMAIHTGLFCFRSLQNYAFKGWLSLETMKLWSTDKTTIFNDLDYKADIGQHFQKVKNPPGGATVTK